MPATPVYALPYPASADPADVPTDVKKLADQVALVLGGALSATPPATPIEGQLWATQPAAGVVWVFRYNAGSASAFKWELVAGSPLVAEQTADFNTTSTTYVDGTAALPVLTLPRAGDYDLSFGGRIYFGGSAAWQAFMTIKLGAAAAADAQASQAQGPNPSAVFVSVVIGRQLRLTGRAAGDTLAAWHKTNGQNCGFTDRWVRAVPVRVS